METTAYIAVGSNKGDRRLNIMQAIKLLEKEIYLLRISSFIPTPPEEGVKGGGFFNGVLSARTSMTSDRLFRFLQSVEQSLGRSMPREKGEERSIDLDLIFYGTEVSDRPGLTVPHPRYSGRYFVVQPLLEIAPKIRDPKNGAYVADLQVETRNEGNQDN